MLSTRAPAQVAQSVEQWTENPIQSALPLTPNNARRHTAALERAIARFWLRVDQTGGPDACHPWTGSIDKDGYGVWYPERGVRSGAHRTALELKLGRRLVPGEETRHVNGCRSRACCNQDHLEPGTHQQNIADREASGATQKGGKHWKARLTEDEVRSIKARLAAGESAVAIASQSGVGPRCISHIATGKNWKHVQAAAS